MALKITIEYHQEPWIFRRKIGQAKNKSKSKNGQFFNQSHSDVSCSFSSLIVLVLLLASSVSRPFKMVSTYSFTLWTTIKNIRSIYIFALKLHKNYVVCRTTWNKFFFISRLNEMQRLILTLETNGFYTFKGYTDTAKHLEHGGGSTLHGLSQEISAIEQQFPLLAT